LGHAAELGGEVDVADEVRRAGNNQQQILKQAAGARSRPIIFSWPSAPARNFSVTWKSCE